MSFEMRNYDFSQISVLVAEHNDYTRQTLRNILKTFNIGTVIESNDLDDAWESYQRAKPDLLFIDWAPSFDGMALLRKIRRNKQSVNPFIPVIVVTAMTEAESVLTARDLGMTEFLAKPFSPRIIYNRLRSIVESRRAFVRTGEFFGPDRRRRDISVRSDRRDATNDNPETDNQRNSGR